MAKVLLLVLAAALVLAVVRGSETPTRNRGKRQPSSLLRPTGLRWPM